jgi:hypothetical protein
MIIYHDVVQGSPEWLDMREKLWTGSTSTRLLQGKTLPPRSDWDGFKDACLRGHCLEHAMKREYDRKYRTKMLRPGFVTNTEYPNAGYSPDGTDGEYLIEMKAFLGEKLQNLIKGKIPLVVLTQIYFGMVILEKKKARLLTIDPDAIDREQLTVIEIPYDKDVCDNIRRKLKLDLEKR